MNQIHIAEVESYEQIIAAIDEYVSVFKSCGALVFRGANLSRDEQLQITRLFGDHLDLFPNSSKGSSTWSYEEDHKATLDHRGNVSKNEILVSWHLEHFGYPNPALGASWNMEKFTCQSGCGLTVFVDTSDIFQQFDNTQQDFLRKCKIAARPIVNFDGPTLNAPSMFNVVQIHEYSAKEIIRMPVENSRKSASLIEFDGRRPSRAEEEQLLHYEELFQEHIFHNQRIRQVHNWKEKDLLIVDLMIMVHAVFGGFVDTERSFHGLWMHKLNKSKWEHN